MLSPRRNNALSPCAKLAKTGNCTKTHNLQNTIIYTAFALVTCAFILIFLLGTSLNGEDYAFQRKWSQESSLERAIWAISRSQTQIETWNARLGEQLSIFWLNAPVWLFTLVATLSFLLVSALVGYFASEGRPSLRKTALASLAIFALWPSMDVFFWRTANAGYLQPMLFLLATASVYLSKFLYGRLSNSPVLLIATTTVAFLSGLSFENSPIGLGSLMLLATLRNWGQNKYLDKKVLIPFASLLAGWSILMLAPSTTLRVNFYRDLFSFPGFTFDYILYRVGDVLTVFLNSSWILFILFLISTVLLMRRKDLVFLAPVWAGVLVTVVTVIPSLYTEQRAFTFSWLLMIATSVRALETLVASRPSMKRELEQLTAGVAVATALVMIPAYWAFGSELRTRDEILSSYNSGCFRPEAFIEITTTAPQRLMNNRDVWSVSSSDQVRRYYGCSE